MSADPKGILCVADALCPATAELLGAGRALADSRGEPLALLLADGAEAEAAAALGADRLLLLEGPSLAGAPEDAWEAALKPVLEAESPRAVLLPGTVFGRSLAPRLAVALRAGLVSDALTLRFDPEGRLLAERSICSGNAVAEILVGRWPALATLRPMAFPRAVPGQKKAEILRRSAPAAVSKARVLSFVPEAAAEIELGGADKVVSGGRGLGGPEGFAPLRELAALLGAAVGASRTAVDAGWIPYRHQVGLTGRSIRPRLYVACGISGQIQHLAGMRSSEVIVGINQDPDCPMMKLATFSVQGDLVKLVPALSAEIRRLRGA
ncbi:MAG TPA: electron transfer flavoprotein subunit alpha [Elusimicrobia bacterium]|nr:electron transfer flavoprotein subunit alpha [Elusimicrobiota bacterium]